MIFSAECTGKYKKFLLHFSFYHAQMHCIVLLNFMLLNWFWRRFTLSVFIFITSDSLSGCSVLAGDFLLTHQTSPFFSSRLLIFLSSFALTLQNHQCTYRQAFCHFSWVFWFGFGSVSIQIEQLSANRPNEYKVFSTIIDIRLQNNSIINFYSSTLYKIFLEMAT